MPPVLWLNATRRKAYEKLSLAPNQREEADAAIAALGNNPRPDGCKKLKGQLDGTYRIKICGGDFRVLYRVTDAAITLVEVVDRKDAYR